mgnify:CR=1 FL=1
MIGRLLRGGFMTLVYAYLYIPIVILIVNSFNASRFGINWQGFTTKWYATLLNNDSLLQAAPALAGGVTVATWVVWGIGSALLLLLGAGLHLLIALWRRRGGSGSGPSAGSSLAAG